MHTITVIKAAMIMRRGTEIPRAILTEDASFPVVLSSGSAGYLSGCIWFGLCGSENTNNTRNLAMKKNFLSCLQTTKKHVPFASVNPLVLYCFCEVAQLESNFKITHQNRLAIGSWSRSHHSDK